jgi:SEC-C motif
VRMRYSETAPRQALQDDTASCSGSRDQGDWLSGRAPRSHRGGHWFDPSIAHHVLGIMVTLVPEVIDADALAFAKLRATYLEPPRQVADALLAAAAWPDIRLKGVTQGQARMRAAEVLRDAGDRSGALEVIENFPDTAAAGPIWRATDCLSAGDIAGACDLVNQVRTWPVSEEYGFSLIITLVFMAAEAGYFDRALAWTDAAWTAAMNNRAAPDWLLQRGPKLLQLVEQEVRDQQHRAAEGDRARTQEAQARPARAADARAPVSASQPWPALVDGRLLWWPHAEYQRLVAQVPDLGYVIGATWQQHTAKVESTLRAFARLHPDSRVVLWLVRAEFTPYLGFLERAGSDPRLPEPLTAYTVIAAERQKPVHWPLGRLDRCWCGSGIRYSRCCGSAVGR